MKIFFHGDVREVSEGIDLLKDQLKIEITPSGIPIKLIKTQEPLLEIRMEKGGGSIYYQERAHFFRGIGLLLESLSSKASFHISENPQFKKIGVMLDCSRNAVLTIDTLKMYLRYMAIMGLNQLMLYTEDTYTIKRDPYFGYMRGRYTDKERSEIDDYGHTLGIEVIPCIQTLAHLSTYLKWKHTEALKDTEDVLFVGESETYEFIEDLVTSASAPFRSNRIHIGMDEAHGLGRGQYLDRKGAAHRYQLMVEHLNRVVQITFSHKLTPMVWSDMFFRVWSEKNAYYDTNIEIPLHALQDLPDGVKLVYWDYYHEQPSFYQAYLKKHCDFGSIPIFAGGIWTWQGPTIHYEKTFKTTNSALNVCKQEGVKEVFATIWGDDGAESQYTLALLGMQLFAEHGYTETIKPNQLKTRFEFCTGASYDAFLSMGELDLHPQANQNQLIPENPTKFLLWQDILIGLFDKNIDGLAFAEHYEIIKEKLEKYAGQNTEWKSLYEWMIKVCSVLSLKSDLGNKLRLAYLSKQNKILLTYIERELNQLQLAVEELRACHRREWFKYNKPFGWEILDIRYGGLLARIETTEYRIKEYLNGNVERIEELEEERLYFDAISKESDGGVGRENKYTRIVSTNDL